MNTIKTVFHSYRFDISNPEEKEQYLNLCEELSSQGLKCFESLSLIGGGHYIPGLDGLNIELETKFIFNNQWNTAPIPGKYKTGLRIFDWAQDYHSKSIGKNPNIKQGHYLEQVPEMSEIRRNTSKCGFCGHQEPSAKGNVFCKECLDSQYLSEDQLRLTRMLPIASGDERGELTEHEKEILLPLYIYAQTVAENSRNKKMVEEKRKKVISEYDKKMHSAKTERDGFIWLMDNNVNIENCIYYDHLNKFSFGWRNPLSDSVKEKLNKDLENFPFDYELK